VHDAMHLTPSSAKLLETAPFQSFRRAAPVARPAGNHRVDVACRKVEAERLRQPSGGSGQRGAAHPRAFVRPARPSRRRSAAAGTFDAEVVLARLVEWSKAHGGAPRAYDWDPPLARAMGLATEGCERWERDHPRWPGHATVVRYFGCWAHALHAAGLAPPPPDRELALNERIATARRLHAEGFTKSAIADVVGVSRRTVGNNLLAQPCTGCGTPVVKSSSGRCRECAAAARPPAPWNRDSVLDALGRWTLENRWPASGHRLG